MNGKEKNIVATKENIQNIIEYFKTNAEKGREYFDSYLLLEDALTKVESQADFYILVQNVIKLQNDLSEFLPKDLVDLTPLSTTALIEKINRNEELSFFSTLINLNELSKQLIFMTKERLSIAELKKILPKEKEERAIAFINDIKNLKDVANTINAEANRIREQLRKHPSDIEINSIENITTKLSEEFIRLLQEKLDYPEDEETAGAIIKYLETNPHIRSILQSFDFQEGLEDDFLAARARNAAASPRI